MQSSDLTKIFKNYLDTNTVYRLSKDPKQKLLLQDTLLVMRNRVQKFVTYISSIMKNRDTLLMWLANNYSMACSIYKFIMKAEHFVTTRKYDTYDEHIKAMQAILLSDPDLTVTYRSILYPILKPSAAAPASSLAPTYVPSLPNIDSQAGYLLYQYHRYCTKQHPTALDNIKCLDTFEKILKKLKDIENLLCIDGAIYELFKNNRTVATETMWFADTAVVLVDTWAKEKNVHLQELHTILSDAKVQLSKFKSISHSIMQSDQKITASNTPSIPVYTRSDYDNAMTRRRRYRK